MIGLYAHHHGSGHLHRVRAICNHLTDDSRILSTHADADVVLPDDAPEPHVDRTAHGTLHHVPVGHDGFTSRMAAVARWIDENRPSAFYVDVSVEVAVLARLMGVPVVTLAMPGIRVDAPHQLGYQQAAAIIAAWPDWVPTPAHLAAHADRLVPVGGISRFDGAVTPGGRDKMVVVLRGAGGDDWDDEQWESLRAACPDHEVVVLGGATRVEDPTEYLTQASVVISASGQNSVADIAVTGTPAVFLPQDRPFGEQAATARVLEEAGLAVVLDAMPAAGQWPGILTRAAALGADWSRWQTDGAAVRAASVIMEVASR